MRRAPAGRMGLAGSAALVAHLCLLALLVLSARPLTLRQYGDDAFEISLVPPVFLPRRAKTPPPSAPHPRPAKVRDATVAPLPMAPSESPAAPSPVAAAAAPAEASGPGVGAALRSRLGCTRAELSREERQACADALGRGARQVATLGQTVPAEKQAYYDAVKAARQSDGHGPGIGCHIRFGGGKPASVEVPAHGLKLGPLPCFIVPPAGMLSPEADVPNPY